MGGGPWRGLRLALACAALALALAALAAAADDKVIELTDLNFDELVPGTPPTPWVIDIYAPWCPACQDMEPAWQALGEELHPDIKVGKIDGTTQKGLLTRFQVQHFPSIYHINNTETREYDGPRTLKKLAHFAREGWQEVQPRRRCSSPVTTCGRLVGRVTRIPAQAKQYYFFLKDTRKYSDLTLVAGLLAVPVALGMSIICLIDAYYTRNTGRPLAPPPPAHLHHE